MATIAERYRYGRKAMDTIYSGASVFWIVGFLALLRWAAFWGGPPCCGVRDQASGRWPRKRAGSSLITDSTPQCQRGAKAVGSLAV